MIKFLIQKEFKQIFRNKFLPKLIFIYPIMMLLLMPYAANMEMKNINLSVVDNDNSTYSRRFIEKVGASQYFNLISVSESYKNELSNIESDKSDVIIEIPQNFEKKIVKENRIDIQISANAVNGQKGSIGASYLSAVFADFLKEVKQEKPDKTLSQGINIIPKYMFNTYMDYKIFMVPALMVMLLTIICGFLPALNIVGEKENGTIEQINVTPVKKINFIIAKLLPYWIIGFFILTVGFVLAYFMYGLYSVGSYWTVYFAATLFVLAISGFGLVISNNSDTMQQAMFVMFFFMLIMILLSGLLTPINSMPFWAQAITALNPLRYFIIILRDVSLKGSNIVDLSIHFWALLGFAIVFNLFAVFSYKKSN